MYTSNIDIPNTPMDKLINVLKVADRLCVQQLREKCLSSLLRRKIEPYNVIELFDLGIQIKHEGMRQKCLDIIKNKGIRSNNIREDISLVCILAILTQEKIALASEAHLLKLAMSWLSHPKNVCYKQDILSFIDLSSIDWAEYRNISRNFPNMFTESELVSILMSVASCNVQRLPEWYNGKVTSVKRTCSFCTHVVKRINFLEHLNLLQINIKEEAIKKMTTTFRIICIEKSLAKLVQIELCFGPKDIPQEEFSAAYRIHTSKGADINKPCFMDVIQSQNTETYILTFDSGIKLKMKECLTLTFNFKEDSKSYNMRTIQPVDRRRFELLYEQKRNFNAIPSISVTLNSASSLTVFAPQNKEPRFLVSAFTFRFCDNHTEYLERKIHSPTLLEPPAKKIKTENCNSVDLTI